jgi:hypothetical protein
MWYRPNPKLRPYLEPKIRVNSKEENMADEKEVSISLTFKQIALDLDDQKFAAILNDSFQELKARANSARAQYASTKGAQVKGVPSLEEKGVGVTVSISF